MYDIDDNQLVYNRRQIKYLFSSLIEHKFDEKMKPSFEKLLQQEQIANRSSSNYYQTVAEGENQNLMKKAKKMDLFDPLQVIDFYKKSRQIKNTMAVEEELRDKIIQFAKNLEMDKGKDYEQSRKKFHLSYHFNNEVKEDDAQIPESKKKLRKYLSQVKLKHNVIDHSDALGRGMRRQHTQKELDDDEKIKKEKTTFNQIVDVDRYYLVNENYHDDVPFDLYNMVSLAKRIDFKTKLDLQDMKDVT